jgi:transketolase
MTKRGRPDEGKRVIGNYRDALGEAFIKMGEEFPDLVVITADVGKSTRASKFGEKYPERFFTVGIAEQNAVGIAAGISTFGIPVIYTAYAVFATEKPFEQIRNMVAYPHLNVKIVATHGGINVGKDGVTHQAVEDMAIMRAIPGMKVVAAADPGEVVAALRAVIREPGPAYLRLGRESTEMIHEDPDQVAFEIGRSELLREGNDVSLLGVGMMVWESLRAADLLKEEGVRARVVNVRTVKPIDEEMILKAASDTRAIVTAEDHNRHGGLGGAVAEVLVRLNPVPMEQIALDDVFAESGTCQALFGKYNLTAEAICGKAKIAVERKKKLR